MSRDRNSLKRADDGASELLSTLPVALLVVLVGLIISLYSAFVHSFTVRGSAEDCLKRAALSAAAKLSAVAVDDPVFGRVGLCDRTPDDGRGTPIVSLNSLYAALRLDHLIARQLDLPYVDELVFEDCQRLRAIEQRLRLALSRAALAGGDEAHKDSLYNSVYDILSKGKGGDRLVTCRLKLGTTAPAVLTTLVPYVGDPDSPSQSAPNGDYKAGADIEIAEGEWTQLYQLAAQPKLCDEHFFQAATAKMTPSMVLVEAVYTSTGNEGGVGVTRTLSACAAVGAPAAAPPPAALMVSFPQGAPARFNSLLSVLTCKSTATGKWQRTVQGPVPGKGHLEGGELADTAPAPAAQQCFYHWLRSQGTAPSLPQVAQVVRFDWFALKTDGSAAPDSSAGSKPAVNSALTKDTGARLFAYINQSGPGGSGQPALHTAFSGVPMNAYFPPSALPLQIDAHGNCHMAGRVGFDDKLIQDFWISVYRTNWAAVESGSIARSVSERMTRAVKETEKQIYLTTEELNSVGSRLGRAAALSGAENNRELTRLRRSQNELTAAVATLNAKLEDYRRVKQRAQKLSMNADYTARVTYDLQANAADFARDGLFAVSAPAGFLLRDNIVFVPKTVAAGEDELYAPAAPAADSSSWISDHFNVMQRTTSGTTIAGRPIADLPALRNQDVAKVRFLLFDSRQLTAGPVAPVELDRSPFAANALDSGHLVYYACDAVVTGKQPSVGWSMLNRDLLTGRARGVESTVASDMKWCAADQFAAANGPRANLAEEIQIRAQVPLIPNLPVGSSLSNPQSGREHVLQIPPMPASML